MVENQPDRLKEIEAQLRHDGPEGTDVNWLISEIKRLRKQISSIPVAEIEWLRMHGDQDDSSAIANAADVVYLWLEQVNSHD